MSSGLPLKADLAQCSRHFAFASGAETFTAFWRWFHKDGSYRAVLSVMAGATLIERFAVGVADAALAVVADHGEGMVR
jgi:hypothetical protein